MSFYRNRVYPHIVTVLGNPKPIQKIGQQIIPLAQGTVLEVGVGPGVNFAYYNPAKVSKVYALEPNSGMVRRAESQHRRAELDVEFLDLPGERIPLPDASVDTVVSTFTLCTIPGVADAIRGIGRVLRPGGQFLFFEHGLSPEFAYSAGKNGRSLCINGLLRAAMSHATFQHLSRREGFESSRWRQGTSLAFQNPDRITSGASRAWSRSDSR